MKLKRKVLKNISFILFSLVVIELQVIVEKQKEINDITIEKKYYLDQFSYYKDKYLKAPKEQNVFTKEADFEKIIYAEKADDIIIEPLSASSGSIIGPSGKETYYNLDMSGVIGNAQAAGIDGIYWIREDGAKMLGDYIMCACDISGTVHNRYDLVSTSLGTGICVDTGGFALSDPNQIDIATNW